MAGRKLAPIITEKHISQFSVTTVALGGISVSTVAVAVAVNDKNATNEVEQGTLVKAVFVERWITSDDASSGSFLLTVEKIPASADIQTFAVSQDLMNYPNKKNLLYTTQGLNNPRAGVATPVIRQWIAIPKGKQRMGLGDRIVVNISAITNGLDFCGFNLYKEYK